MRISLTDAINRAKRTQATEQGFTNFKQLNNFFLKDGEKAVIKLLVENAADIPVVRTHTVQIFSKVGKKYFIEVSCNADKGECPFCNAKHGDKPDEIKNVSFAHDKLIIPIIVLERNGVRENTYALFIRSINFYTNTLSVYALRFDMLAPIEISRNGVGTSTAYTMFPPIDLEAYKIDKSLTELKTELDVSSTDVVGRVDSIVKTWGIDQMYYFLETGNMPTKANMEGNRHTKSVEEQPTVTRRVSNHGF